MVDFAAPDRASGAGPGSIATGKLIGTFGAHAEQFFGSEDFFLGEELVAFECVTDCLFEDLDIGQVRIAFQRVNTAAQAGKAGAKGALVGVRDRYTRGRDQVELPATALASGLSGGPGTHGRWRRWRHLLSDQNDCTRG